MEPVARDTAVVPSAARKNSGVETEQRQARPHRVCIIGRSEAPACNKKRESSVAGKTLPFSAGGGAAFGSVAGSIFGGLGDTAFARGMAVQRLVWIGQLATRGRVHVLAGRPYLVDERHRRVGDESATPTAIAKPSTTPAIKPTSVVLAARCGHVFGFVHMRCGAETPSNPSRSTAPAASQAAAPTEHCACHRHQPARALHCRGVKIGREFLQVEATCWGLPARGVRNRTGIVGQPVHQRLFACALQRRQIDTLAGEALKPLSSACANTEQIRACAYCT